MLCSETCDNANKLRGANLRRTNLSCRHSKPLNAGSRCRKCLLVVNEIRKKREKGLGGKKGTVDAKGGKRWDESYSSFLPSVKRLFLFFFPY